MDWLEDRLTQRDEKTDGLYIELRKEQEEKINWIHKCHEVELIKKESEVKSVRLEDAPKGLLQQVVAGSGYRWMKRYIISID